MIRASFLNIEYPSITFSEIRIDSGSGDLTATYAPRLIKLGELILGNDDPDDPLIMFPGRLKIDFFFPVAESNINGVFSPSVSQATLDYYSFLESVRSNGATIALYKEGQADVYYAAAFNTEDNGLIQANPATLTASLIFLDDYTKMQEEINIPSGSDGLWPAGGTYSAVNNFHNLILSLFKVTERGGGAAVVNSVEILSKIRFQKPNGDGTYTPVYLQGGNIGMKNYYFYIGDSDLKGSILKRLLMNLCSYAIIGFNKALKIYPFWYDGGEVIHIEREQIESDIVVDYSKKYDGINILCPYLSNTNNDNALEYNYEQLPYGKFRWKKTDARGRALDTPVLTNIGQVKSIEILAACGLKDTNSIGNSKIVRYLDPATGSSSNLKAGAVSLLKPDGSYSDEHSLAEWTGSLLWKALGGKGRKVTATLPGINYTPDKKFTVEGFSAYFRLLQMSFDYDLDQTKVVVWECPVIDDFTLPTSVIFARLLRAFEYSVEIKRRLSVAVYTYMDFDGESHTTDNPMLGPEQLIVKIKNVYNCGSSIATEYDGIQLAVSDYDKKLWRDLWNYVIYIAIGKTKNTTSPASPYPVADDANADWFLLDTIFDQQIDDPGYYYQYTISAKKIQTKNPFWVWVGLKSTSAPLFERIPYYAR